MFAVDHVLVSDAVLDAPFACHLGACLGACCVHGDSGAPLEPEERAALEQVLPVVEADLRPEARATIRREGVWEEVAPGEYATTCVDGRECVFVVYEGPADRPVAKCAIQQAYQAGRVGFEKPISCHLFPIRVQRHGEGADAVEVLNYEQIGLCSPAVRHGRRTGVQLADFLERPLTRRYGPRWYRKFREAVAARRAALADAPAP
ncbi:MAG TPA: DUF3109 family protein [Rubricoccaceae bacterium]|nr:DUF3109 family protein [Rubricoccaceae bacterium]